MDEYCGSIGALLQRLSYELSRTAKKGKEEEARFALLS
jgi:hypothetical protein